MCDENEQEDKEFYKGLNPGVESYLTEIGKIFTENAEGLTNVGKKIEQVRNNLSAQLSEAFKSFEELADKMRRAYPVVAEYSSRLKAEGWVIPLSYPLNNIHYFSELHGQEITKKIVSFYVRNNYYYLYETFDSFIYNLPEGYKKEFEKMSVLLKEDISNYKLIVPWLYMVLDYRFSMKFIDSNLGKQNDFMREKTVNKMIYNYKKNKKRNLFIEIYHADALDLIFDDIKYYSFANEPKFNRHFVLHGRMHPNEYQFIDFLRLLNLSALSSNFLK